MAEDTDTARNSAAQLTESIGAPRSWRVFAVVEVLLAAAAVAFDVFLPTIVILLLASISLAVRRTSPASLGFRWVPRPGRMIITVFLLSVGWSLFQIGLTKPILNHLTGQQQDLSQFEGYIGTSGCS